MLDRHEERQKWFFSVIDIVAVLTNETDHKKAKSCWSTLKSRLKKEGSKVIANCEQLKMQAQNGKLYKTKVADLETILRLIGKYMAKPIC